MVKIRMSLTTRHKAKMRIEIPPGFTFINPFSSSWIFSFVDAAFEKYTGTPPLVVAYGGHIENNSAGHIYLLGASVESVSFSYYEHDR
jgi:hypothetical protein